MTGGPADPPSESATIVARGRALPAVGGAGGDLRKELLTAEWWTDARVAAAGVPVVNVPFVTVGGGIGSFVTVDYLRIAGVPTGRIRVVSVIGFPWQTYEYLARVSQIPPPNASARIPHPGPTTSRAFPSYAVAEAARDKTLAPLWQVLVLLMEWRREKDWPTLFGLIEGIPEGALIRILLSAAAIPAIVGTVSGADFLIQFILVWLGAWLVVNGPMRVPFIRWRFRGGRLV